MGIDKTIETASEGQKRICMPPCRPAPHTDDIFEKKRGWIAMGGETTISTEELTELAQDYVFGIGVYTNNVIGTPEDRGLELILRIFGENNFKIGFSHKEGGHLIYRGQHYPTFGGCPY